MGFAVFLDTCTLYPAHLRDTFLRLAELGLYQPLWSCHILRELSSNLESTAQIDTVALERLLGEMRGAFPEAQVDGYEDLIESMACHPKDRHVLAAAVRGKAGAIVTFNLSDFPDTALKPYEIEVIHPDDFLLDLLDLAPDLVIEELERQAQANRRRPATLRELLDALSTIQINKFVEEVRGWKAG
ncbi:MAG: PIN domain-containing protein [Acidimicrobiia bacterium]|nr:PIN domain-containing protein [bacterium]MXX01026.1 PIN domain-containing protein [Acidimicrobiia bacterium]MDE0674422.1 PIN domain-containing protein [bacterium]MXX45337.1 PIN domain-containing protein [Acidimicrobiia bacterium]MYB77899.1 PIN domain-containing protein [Acidimicrobiia bacterium]